MRNLRFILPAIAMMAFVSSCSHNDEPTPNPDEPTGKAFKGIIFATGITNPEGNSGSVYMQSLPDMVPGNYDNSNAIPVFWYCSNSCKIGKHLCPARLHGQYKS